MKTTLKTYSLSMNPGGTASDISLPSVSGLQNARDAAKAAALANPKHFVNIRDNGNRVATYVSDNGRSVRSV